MKCDYRLCHRPSSPLPGYQIHEVYYDDLGNVKLYSKEPIAAYGDITDELYRDMCAMMDAFDKDPIDLDAMDLLMEKTSGRKTN